MTIIIDTNVVLDVLIHRAPFFADSELVLLATEQKYVDGYVTASAITDIFYITNKYLKDKTATQELLKNHLIGTVNIAAVDGDIIVEALNAGWDDFEDSVQYVTGKSIKADYIVSRNTCDFSTGTIKAITPKEFLDIIAPE
ncbi:MAG: PIN domain-containing protein [Oscillospiraceae bacterium]|nr:PIN domain-containing protein [Oscillospiraceae bacterium]